MKLSNSENAPRLNTGSIVKRALYGAGIAYVLITLFLLIPGVRISPNWPTYWMLRPLAIVPLAGAAGGIFYHLMNTLVQQHGWKKLLSNVVSLVVYVIGLWLGTVLGLAGTLWN